MLKNLIREGAGWDRIKRAIAFYLSVTLFIVLLPITLSYSLGYKIDFKKLKAYKTGIIYLKSHPSGASVCINGALQAETTPAQIGEMKPGAYRVGVSREGFYPWEKVMEVRPNMVTRADRIILFPVRHEMKPLPQKDASDFLISDKNDIYYFAKEGLFRSGIDGSNLKKLSGYSPWPDYIVGKSLSRDGGKLLFFDERSIWVVYLNTGLGTAKQEADASVEKIMGADNPIMEAFWHSSSSYIIVVTSKEIAVSEARPGTGNIVSLYKFSALPRAVHYDKYSDSLYFTDNGRLYKLELTRNFFETLLSRLLLKKEIEAGYEKR